MFESLRVSLKRSCVGEKISRPSFQGNKLILGIVMASHGTRGFLQILLIINLKIELNSQVRVFPEAEGLHELDVITIITMNSCQV